MHRTLLVRSAPRVALPILITSVIGWAACSSDPAGKTAASTSTSTSSGAGGAAASSSSGAGGALPDGGSGNSSSTSGAGGGGGNIDAGDDGAASDAGNDSGSGAVCGNGKLEPGESCDDGVIKASCDAYTNGGDGHCVPPGTCSPGYVYVMGSGCLPALAKTHVHVDVDNFCNMTVTPMEYTVPAGTKLQLSYHNHSMDYPIDVWLSYIGGYTDLMTGATWDDQYQHCGGPMPYEAYADISTACSSFHLKIHCQ